MSAHEKGIKAAVETGAEVDWVIGAFGSGMDGGDELFSDMMRAYLEASAQVLVPREPTNEMKAEADRARNNALYQDENDQIGALNIAIFAAIEAYPQPFSQDKT